MKTPAIFKRFFIFTVIICIFTIISCVKKETPESVRMKQERNITVTNNTGNLISGYMINAGTDGTEITRGRSFSEKSIVIKIGENWNNDPDIEVIFVDQYNNIFKKTVRVPLNKNTDISIGQEDKISQGLIKDAINKFIEWINKNK